MIRVVKMIVAIVAMAGATQSETSLFAPDHDVMPGIVSSGGYDNGSFSGFRPNGIELGLRGEMRFNDLAELSFDRAGGKWGVMS